MDINLVRKPYHRLKQALPWLNYKYRSNFVFVHIHKTGGTSIEHALFIPNLHNRALTQRQWFGEEEYSNRFVFSVVRNPWDLVVSLYFNLLQTNQFSEGNQPSFKEWLKLRYIHQDPQFHILPGDSQPQLWWLEDDQNNIIVDFVAKLENIHKDWQCISNKIGQKVRLPHKNKSSRGDYRQYYCNETYSIVQETFMRDIDYFSYKF